jgi:methionyl-tRNA formyltransferase
MTTYLVAATKPWNIVAFDEETPRLAGAWHLITDPAELTVDLVRSLSPRYVFFPHWSWRVPDEILEAAECICFHMTDVPYGRGGSPLQNLICRGHDDTRVSALRMVEEMDAGPVYLKRDLSLSGSAQEIYERTSRLVYEMIAEIITEEPEPVAQTGPPTTFRRRTPDQSALPQDASIQGVYNHIRMLDAETYPTAFIDHSGLRLEFSQAHLVDGEVIARVRIKAREPDNSQ